MAKLHFNIDNKEYIMEFLPDYRVKIIPMDNKNKGIIFQYFADTKVIDFMKYIKYLDFSKLKDKTLYTVER